MITYIFNILNEDYTITPINKTEIETKFKVPSENFVNVYPLLDTIIVSEHSFNNAGLSNLSRSIQASDNGTLKVYEDSVLQNTYSFNKANVKYDDFKEVYEITLNSTDGIDSYLSNKKEEINILDTTIPKYELTATQYTGILKGNMKMFDVLEYLIKQSFGIEYNLVSTFFSSEINLYLLQASNVIEAAENSDYNAATAFEISIETLLNDLKLLFDIELQVDGTDVILEKHSYFEALISNVGFNTTISKYSGMTQSQETYEYLEDDLIKIEGFKNTYDSEIFKNRNITYNNSGGSIEYQLSGYTDLTGLLTKPNIYSATGFFYVVSDDGVNVNSEDYPFSTIDEKDYTTASIYYSLEDNELLTRTSTPAPTALGGTYVGFTLKTKDVFNVNTGSKLYPRLYLQSWENALTFLEDSISTLYVNLPYKVFIADNSQKSEDNEWEDCAVSNIISKYLGEGETYPKGTYLYSTTETETGSIVYYLFQKRIKGESVIGTNYVTIPDIADNELTINADTPDAVLIFKMSIASIKRNSYLGNNPKYIETQFELTGEGESTILNTELAFVNLIPEYKTYNRLNDTWTFNNETYVTPEKTKRTLKGVTEISLDNYSDFVYNKYIFTQFGIGEIQSATINMFKKTLNITGLYGSIYRLSDGNLITNFYFDSLKSIRITDDTIICEAYEGTELSTISPDITVSPFATYSELSTDYSNPVDIVVTSESRVSRTYTIIITIAKPKFYFNSGSIFYTTQPSFTDANWITNTGDIVNNNIYVRFSGGDAGYVILDNDNYNLLSTVTLNNVTNLVDLRAFDALTTFVLENGDNLTILLPDNLYAQLDIRDSDIQEFDLTQFTNLNNCDIDLSYNTDFDPNKPLIQIDNKGWTNGQINVSGNGELSEAGETAKNNIEAKGWSVITD